MSDREKAVIQDKYGLFNDVQTSYGENYQEHLLDQYKLYLDIENRLAERRSTTNTFFLTANTLFLSGIGVLSAADFKSISTSPLPAVAWTIAGIFLCVVWRQTVRSYKQLSTGRFQIIHVIESRLPLSIFKAEWKVLGEGKNPKIYRPLTLVESDVPLIFAALYVAFVLLSLVSQGYIQFKLP